MSALSSAHVAVDSARPEREPRASSATGAGRHGQWQPGVDRAAARVPAEHGVAASRVALTHFHADHAGGAAPWACRSPRTRPRPGTRATRGPATRGSGFEIPPYRVDRALRDGDTVGGLVVVHTPGQTPGHVAYWHEPTRTAITGDLMQHGDVAWVPFGGPWADGALDAMIESVRTIAALEPGARISGHGPAVDDVPAAVELTLRALRAVPRASRRGRSGTPCAARWSRT